MKCFWSIEGQELSYLLQCKSYTGNRNAVCIIKCVGPGKGAVPSHVSQCLVAVQASGV